MKEYLIEEGLVLEWDSIRGVQVQLGVGASCDGCPAESLCKGEGEDRLLWVPTTTKIEEGTRVRVQIDGNDLLRSSFRVFGLPLLLFALGAFLADLLIPSGTLHDLWVCFAALVALSAGMLHAAIWQKGQEKEHPNFRAKLIA